MNIKTILFKSIKYIVLFFLIFLLILNTYLLIFKKDLFTVSKIQSASLKQGESYQGYLNLWHFLAQTGDWNNASKLESKLDMADISYFKTAYQPEILKNNLNVLNSKENKSPDDYIELARINSFLGNNKESIENIKTAYQLDPIREDISKLYYLVEK